jgi:hypothetical protein
MSGGVRVRCTLALFFLAIVACRPGVVGPASDGGGVAGPTDGGAVASDGGPSGTADGGAPSSYTDFPAAPVIDGTAPASSPSLFAGDGDGSGGPCLLEPEPGSLIPRNWLRPRFRLQPASGQNLFEIRLRVDNQASDLVVYTDRTTWTMPHEMWLGLTQHSAGRAIRMTVRGAVFDGTRLTSRPAVGADGDITIAPVTAAGQVVYWTTSNGTALKGFAMGEEIAREVLRPPQAGTHCVGCHTSTPDGRYAAFSASNDPRNGVPSNIGHRSVDGQASAPSYISTAAQALLARVPQHTPTYSKSHWSAGDRIVLTMLPVNDRWEVLWTDLEATSQQRGVGWGVLNRTGDSGHAASANFSHDGSRIVYVSSPNVVAGTFTQGQGDLYMIPFNNRQGGAATKLAGASDPTFNEYYPAFSPDDRLVAFNGVPNDQTAYNNAAAELFVVPSEGGTAVRLRANDPPACSGRSSPGVTNSWPKWSPAAVEEGGKTYYFLTFSSTRNEGGKPQIFATTVVVEGSEIQTYPALYLWNQPAEEANHTAAWDVFRIR